MEKRIIEYGKSFLKINQKFNLEAKGMNVTPPSVSGETTIPFALKNPIASASLEAIAKGKLDQNTNAKAVIVVSDNTRPVPYRGKNGLMLHIIRELLDAGFTQQQITVIIGAGSHRNMEPVETEEMMGLKESGFGKVNIENHEYDNENHLVELGHTRTGSLVKLNKLYIEADLKIVTGLVESHFMAGASGGRKGICPGIVGKETLKLFHGPKFLSSSQAADLILEGNPLNDEALEVAQMAGCDFLVNVTIDAAKNLTGVFAGNLLKAHQEAVKTIKSYVTVPLAKKYDIVLIPAGFVGINHYQAAKAAIEAARAVKQNGKIIIVAKNTDTDKVGGPGYRKALALLNQHGKDKFMEMIKAPGWEMIQEQWQVQMWCKVFDVIGTPENLIYCSLDIAKEEYKNIPGIAGLDFIANEENGKDEIEKMELMLEKAMDFAIENSEGNPEILLLKDGPYGVPEVKE
ncbi:nickel-dependent lactate racemase [Flexithrix dorotheae]|uniref:nickel-dependent lactate racemase n=1 Tax=Flexithrix dorotheae TaxID=70993 RepID=UPI00035F499A|nr:nickel-dependent lactate racemase [Flexithrix dorotheae]